MIKGIYFLLSTFCLAFALTACTSKPTVVAPPQGLQARDGLFSNSILLPSDPTAHFYWPMTKSLTKDIREVGGEVYQSGSFVTIVLPSDVLFEPGTSILLAGAYPLIDAVDKIIVRFPGQSVIITAHTDGIGMALTQAKLSRQQAQLFALTLWQQDNIDLKAFQRFKYAGMSDVLPITSDPSAYGQSLNRRVQITIYPSAEMEEMKRLLPNQEIEQI